MALATSPDILQADKRRKFHKLYTGWLVAHDLISLEQIGEEFGGVLEFSYFSMMRLLTRSPVPVNLKERDAFHITIEEYLLALTNLTEELVRCNGCKVFLLSS